MTPSELPNCLAETRAWVDRAVIGLNLCPFARGVQVKGQVRYALSLARSPAALLDDLRAELQHLVQADPQALDTTLLVHPWVLRDFLDFNDFLDEVEALLDGMDLVGEVQVASFHPDYQFAGTAADDPGNATNRSPYPTLHLLREASIERAVQAMAHPQAIYEANIRTLQALGPQGWAALRAACAADAQQAVQIPPTEPAAQHPPAGDPAGPAAQDGEATRR